LKALINLICKGEYDLEKEAWNVISDEAKDLIRHMLIVEPKDRISAAMALEHPWIKDTKRDFQLPESIKHRMTKQKRRGEQRFKLFPNKSFRHKHFINVTGTFTRQRLNSEPFSPVKISEDGKRKTLIARCSSDNVMEESMEDLIEESKQQIL